VDQPPWTKLEDCLAFLTRVIKKNSQVQSCLLGKTFGMPATKKIKKELFPTCYPSLSLTSNRRFFHPTTEWLEALFQSLYFYFYTVSSLYFYLLISILCFQNDVYSIMTRAQTQIFQLYWVLRVDDLKITRA